MMAKLDSIAAGTLMVLVIFVMIAAMAIVSAGTFALVAAVLDGVI